MPRTVLIVVGTRPNFMKAAALIQAFREGGELLPRLLHTGQHFDKSLSAQLFSDLGLPEPDHHLGISGGTRLMQLSRVLASLDEVLATVQPEAVVVLGDVNSTLAGALAALSTETPLVHVEAGLRSFDRGMPEEVNRVLVDSAADLLFCTEPAGVENLLREGRPASRIFHCGNVMIDTLLRLRDREEVKSAADRFGLEEDKFALLTLHRPSNVDDPAVLGRLLSGLDELASRMPIVFPVHPRTARTLETPELRSRVSDLGLKRMEPLGYLDFLGLLSRCGVVVTDSGGIQEECTVLRRCCVTVREGTERPITVDLGVNRIVGTDPERLREACRQSWELPEKCVPEHWDGRAAERIAALLISWLDGGLPAAGATAERLGVRVTPAGDSGAQNGHPEGPRLPGF